MSSIKRDPIKKSVRDRVKSRFGGRCGYCGEISERLQIDHMHPVASPYGSNDEGNLIPACFQCNNFKGGMNVEEFRRSLNENPRKASDYSVNHRMAMKYGQININLAPVVFYFEREHLK